MDESADLERRQEALMQSIRDVLVKMTIVEVVIIAIFVGIPIYLQGPEAFADGMPLNIFPATIASAISFAYFYPKMQNWKNI